MLLYCLLTLKETNSNLNSFKYTLLDTITLENVNNSRIQIC